MATTLVAGALGASGEHADGHHELPMAAPELFRIPLLEIPVTNSSVVSFFVAAALIVFVQLAMKGAGLRPTRLQNFLEWIMESLQGILGTILGSDLSRKTFWFFASIFIFILVSNWLALFPGVGSIGWGTGDNFFNMNVQQPFLRGVHADVNMTLAMAVIFMGLWLVWSLQANGVGGFFHHIFGAKGGMKGLAGAAIGAVFIFVGVIEVVSICFRPVSLSFRLFGNIYGGEYMLETMIGLVSAPFSWIIPLPFYFLELMVGLVQALVFCLLTAVFTALMCRHDDAHGHPAGGKHH